MFSSIHQRIKNIKIPIFQIAFYSAAAYLGYCYYQDYLFKKLTRQIQQEESPVSKTTSICHKISEAKRTKQLKILLQDLQIYLDLFLINPKKRDSVIDFNVAPREKNQNNKKFWWMSPYETTVKLYSSYFYRASVKKEGVFAIFFWFDLQTKKSNSLIESQNIQKIVRNVLKKREDICYKISTNQNAESDQYEQCIKQSSNSAGRLQKMLDRVVSIRNFQNQQIN